MPGWMAASGALALAMLMLGCQSRPLPPVAMAQQVDLPRFMGDWYVIASIPTIFERDAWNAVERYQLREDGRIDTTFTFLKGGFDGERKTMTPVATVREGHGNALWGMQFLWPFKADFRISWLDEDYRMTVIGREKRDYAWIMARTPDISEADYGRLVAFLARQGYDVSALRKVPQRW